MVPEKYEVDGFERLNDRFDFSGQCNRPLITWNKNVYNEKRGVISVGYHLLYINCIVL